jgi:ABC-type dipeptide/oligopeptide/nickel transport system ATPase component
VLIADEPTTALDVTVQAADPGAAGGTLQREMRHAPLMLITHDLAVLAETARPCRRCCMPGAGGRGSAPVAAPCSNAPRHPYSARPARCACRSIERNPAPTAARKFPGMAACRARPSALPSGCAFHAALRPQRMSGCAATGAAAGTALRPIDSAAVACRIEADG